MAECGPKEGNVMEWPGQWNDVISSMKVECNDKYFGSGDKKIDQDTID